MNEPRTILIAGPTASGKSALALALAEKLGGTVVNADSMQIYRDLRIITARPAPDEERRMPHRLYGHVDAAENYSVGRWCSEVAAPLAECVQQRRAAILVGGTGLYFNALTRGLAAVPPIPAEIRDAVRARLASEGVAVLHAELAARDPMAAAQLSQAIAPASPARLKSYWRPAARFWIGTTTTSRRLSISRALRKFFCCPSATSSSAVSARGSTR